jgi:hypothetical protein
MNQTLHRTEQFQRLRRRYAGRGKEGKPRLLEELCEQNVYERKYAIKLLGDTLPPARDEPAPGPEPKYEPVVEVLATIWDKAEQLWQKSGFGAGLVAAPLRTASRQATARAKETLAGHQPGQRRPRAGFAQRPRARFVRHPIWYPAPPPGTHSRRGLGRTTRGISRGRQRGPLGQSLGGELHLEPHLYLSVKHLDSEPVGVEQGCHERTHSPRRRTSAVPIAGLRLRQQ